LNEELKTQVIQGAEVVKTAALFFHKQNQQAVAKQQLVLYAG
jgi:hypothetical protein